MSGVRKAVPMDLPRMIELGYRLCDQTIYKDVKRHRPSIMKTFTLAMTSKFGFAYVAEHGEKLTGILIGIADHLWFSEDRYATDLLFYSERPGDGLKMLRKFVEWAWTTPRVVEITMGQSSGIDIERMDALYARAGLTKVGSMYAMVKP